MITGGRVLQAGFLVVAGAGAFILAAGDVEVVGHGQADSVTRKAIQELQ